MKTGGAVRERLVRFVGEDEEEFEIRFELRRISGPSRCKSRRGF
jgi:hypothetical protein